MLRLGNLVRHTELLIVLFHWRRVPPILSSHRLMLIANYRNTMHCFELSWGSSPLKPSLFCFILKTKIVSWELFS